MIRVIISLSLQTTDLLVWGSSQAQTRGPRDCDKISPKFMAPIAIKSFHTSSRMFQPHIDTGLGRRPAELIAQLSSSPQDLARNMACRSNRPLRDSVRALEVIRDRLFARRSCLEAEFPEKSKLVRPHHVRCKTITCALEHSICNNPACLPSLPSQRGAQTRQINAYLIGRGPPPPDGAVHEYVNL